MGAWGIRSFENDDAMDWFLELEESGGVALLEQALSTQPEDGYLERDDGCQIVAAVEVIAALLGVPSSDLPDRVMQWVEANKATDVSTLVPKCGPALDLACSPGSENYELWEEAAPEDFSQWKDLISDLKRRVAR